MKSLAIYQSKSNVRLGSECDMTLLGESAHCGKMLISKKIGDEEIYLINQSVTGLYEKKINLHTV